MSAVQISVLIMNLWPGYEMIYLRIWVMWLMSGSAGFTLDQERPVLAQSGPQDTSGGPLCAMSDHEKDSAT